MSVSLPPMASSTMASRLCASRARTAARHVSQAGLTPDASPAPIAAARMLGWGESSRLGSSPRAASSGKGRAARRAVTRTRCSSWVKKCASTSGGASWRNASASSTSACGTVSSRFNTSSRRVPIPGASLSSKARRMAARASGSASRSRSRTSSTSPRASSEKAAAQMRKASSVAKAGRSTDSTEVDAPTTARPDARGEAPPTSQSHSVKCLAPPAPSPTAATGTRPRRGAPPARLPTPWCPLPLGSAKRRCKG